MRFDLVIFDCDGVLVDSEPISARVLARHLEQIGLPMSHEEIDARFTGRSMMSCLETVENLRGKPLPGDFLAELQQETYEQFRADLKAVHGVATVLDSLRIPYCVASSGDHEKMRLTLALTGLRERFEGRIFSATEVPRGKPFPDLFLHAAKSMGAEPSRCAVIEDSEPGVRAAVAAGMTVFGYAERSDAKRLEAAGAVVFDSMEQLPALLTG
jgi:HAD superfamily hydrolase (TIGR01509 family)